MYSHFNPFASGDAWWQHILMLVIAAVLGYIIGYISAKSKADSLRAELQALEIDIDECQQSKKEVIAVTPPVAKAAAVVAPLPAPVVVTTPDDLKVVEGIGPKIEKLLNQEGILTFAQLAETSPERIKEILVAAGPRYQMHNPATWPEQSALARDGQWDALKTWQDELNKGRTH
jgi:predicted flap endonuclease-1-like 5' DNA nuclease